jgi:hypothetical protein
VTREHRLVLVGIDSEEVKAFRLMLEGPDSANQHEWVFLPTSDLLPNGSMRGADAVVVVSASTLTKTDPDIMSIVQKASDHFVPVYFVCDERSGRFTEQAPGVLHPINGLVHQGGAELTREVRKLRHLLGYDERDRRVFISYRREDGEQMASSLRYALIDAGWDVFLDRFTIDPGDDFQRTLDRDLDNRSLVLVVESPLITKSFWVEHEICFARQRGIALHAVQLPTTTSDQRIAAVDDARTRVSVGHFDAGSPSTELADLIDTLQIAHTRAVRTRRDSLLSRAQHQLLTADYEVERLSDWALLGRRNDFRRVVVLATPQTPQAEDLFTARRLRQHQSERSTAWVVHPMRDPDPRTLRVLQSLNRDRVVGLCHVSELARELGVR